MAQAVGDSGGKKVIPRIDMTPMVDLGFLLLTFFVLTTNMNQPITMKIKVPADKDEQTEADEIPQERILILLLTGGDRIYYYQGTDDPEKSVDLNQTNYAGIREKIVEFQVKSYNNSALKAKGFEDANRKLITMIKMTDDATYKNLVDILDEMAITRQSLYNLVEITKREVEMVKDYDNNEGQKTLLEKTLENHPEWAEGSEGK